jgi:hypothetical protein
LQGLDVKIQFKKTFGHLGMMQRRVTFWVGFLLVWFWGGSAIVWLDLDLCAMGATPTNAGQEFYQKSILAFGKSYSLSRNQVLLEIGTGTW